MQGGPVYNQWDRKTRNLHLLYSYFV